MTRFVPFDANYDQIRRLEKTSFTLLVVSALLIMLNWILTKLFDNQVNTQYNDIKELAKVISYVSMVGYLIINVISKILFHNVEKRKRNDKQLTK